ncbi:Cyp6a9 [Trypoxylus dichotomus]
MFRLKRFYEEFKFGRNEKHGGIYFFAQANYMPTDTELIRNILTRDFQHFASRGFQFNEKIDPLSAHLFNLEGQKWKKLRAKLAPAFTAGKMKFMFRTLLECASSMMEFIDRLVDEDQALDIKEILACYTTDVIGSCAFGIECNSFKHPDAEFRRYGRKIFTPSFKFAVSLILSIILPKSVFKSIPIKKLPVEIERFFIDAIANVIDFRTKNNVRCNDFIQLLLDMQEKAKAEGDERLTLEQISAQAFVFFIAGFETSSTTMTFCLHELAFNQEMQSKLRQEIKQVSNKNDGQITYDALMEMKYMDNVINETLRKYPPIAMLNRLCTLDYKVPNSHVTLSSGTNVFISVLGIHYDPEYYPDPEKFDPERFSEENRAERPAFTFLPFGEGPRMCTGIRFGMMQIKIGLSMLLEKYSIVPADGENYIVDFDPRSFVLTKRGAVTLRAKKLIN